MTEGSYSSMDLGELATVFDQIGSVASMFRGTSDVPTSAENYVYLATTGPVEFSTTTALVPVSCSPIWDVNGYYRALGIPWPYRPTRKELREAYQAVDGHNSDQVTYAFKRLLDREFRDHYDRRDLGRPVDDEYRWAAMRRMASKWAREQSRVAKRVITVDDILGEDIVSRMNAQAESERKGEELQELREERGPEGEREEVEEQFVWPFAYFLLNSRKFDDETLAEWQRLLIASFAHRGLSLQVAVGYFGRAQAAAARVSHPRPEGGHIEILFLHEDEAPSAQLADVVVATYHTHPQHRPLIEPLYLHGSTTSQPRQP